MNPPNQNGSSAVEWERYAIYCETVLTDFVKAEEAWREAARRALGLSRAKRYRDNARSCHRGEPGTAWKGTGE